MEDKFSLDNCIKQGLTVKVNEAKPSAEMLPRIINRIEAYEGGKENMLRDRILNIKIKKLAIVSLCAVLVISGMMFTFSEDVRAAAMDAIRTIFVLDKTEYGYKLVEKTDQDEIFQFIIGRTSQLNDEELTNKIGFNVHFPEALNEEFRLKKKSEQVGIKRKVSLEAWKQLQPEVLKAINDEAVFESLSKYAPYRGVSGAYKRKEGAAIFIQMLGPDAPAFSEDSKTDIQTKVGDIDAYWIKRTGPNYQYTTLDGVGMADYYTKPNGLVKNQMLIWESDGIRYELGAHDIELTMKEAVKIAEFFMAQQ